MCTEKSVSIRELLTVATTNAWEVLLFSTFFLKCYLNFHNEWGFSLIGIKTIKVVMMV